MSSTTDRILDLIDAGLQSSAEHGYEPGTQAEPDTPLCLRCGQHERVERIEMCAGCRAFLLGDGSDDPAAANDGFELVNGYREVIGTIDHVERREDGEIWVSGEVGTFVAADPAPTTQWQAEARRHLGDCFDELASDVMRPLISDQLLVHEEFVADCQALGLTEQQASRLWWEETSAPDLETQTYRAIARASLLAAGHEPGPPGRQGDEWRRRYDPHQVRPPTGRIEYWRRRAMVAIEMLEPVHVTPEERDEIRRLPEIATGIDPFDSRCCPDGSWEERVFGAPIAVELSHSSGAFYRLEGGTLDVVCFGADAAAVMDQWTALTADLRSG